jgi:osmotically-inducible protein OsmY
MNQRNDERAPGQYERGPGQCEHGLDQSPPRRQAEPGPNYGDAAAGDERLREEISERLMQADSIVASDVSVQVLGGKVILEGTVRDRYMKHAIEDLAEAAPGVQDIDNRIRVVG